MGFFSSILGLDAGKATKKAAEANNAAINTFQSVGNQAINTGEQKSAGALNTAAGYYDPYMKSGTAATGMYGNALGLNGADGTAAATGAFQAGPGYDFALKQGEQSALRAASAGGMLNSGNTLAALTQYGQGMANQEYGSWLDRLAGASNQGLSAAGGAAGVQGGIANLYQNTTADRLGLESTAAQGRIGVNNQIGQAGEAKAGAKSALFGKIIDVGTKIATGGLF